jgi:dihydrofolate reductase
MGRIVMFNRITADGYFADADGKLDWVVPDEELDKGAQQHLKGPGTMMLGRRTYDTFESFWPHAVEDASSPAPHGSKKPLSPEQRAMGQWINEATKFVFSKNRKDVTWKNSKLLRAVDPREIEAIKNQSGGDILIFGSGSVVTQLTQHGLIDEYQFIVNPVILGNGQSLVKGLPKSAKLDLQDVTKFRSGNVMLRYARSK